MQKWQIDEANRDYEEVTGSTFWREWSGPPVDVAKLCAVGERLYGEMNAELDLHGPTSETSSSEREKLWETHVRDCAVCRVALGHVSG